MRPERVEGTDETLLARAARSDLGAFEALYDRYSGPVYSLACGLLRDTHAAQEITQDVFLAIWHRGSSFDAARGSARSWILSLAHHKSVDAMRRGRRLVAVPLPETTADAADVIEDAMARVDSAGVQEALRALSDEQRQALVLAYYGGYTQQEIADRLRTPLGTIKTRIRDGLLRLRSTLGAAAGREATR